MVAHHLCYPPYKMQGCVCVCVCVFVYLNNESVLKHCMHLNNMSGFKQEDLQLNHINSKLNNLHKGVAALQEGR